MHDLILMFDFDFKFNYRGFEVGAEPVGPSERALRRAHIPMTTDQDTEARIFEAARKVFVEQGPSNARMQDIADEAGITSSLLHYYYRSRDQLFEKVFEEEVLRMIPRGRKLIESDRPLEEKISEFARVMVEFHRENPHLAMFVAYEAHYNPDHLGPIKDAMEEIDLSPLRAQIESRVEAGTMRPIRAEDLLANLQSMCIFPVIARPILQSILDLDEAGFEQFLEHRETSVPDFLVAALRPESS